LEAELKNYQLNNESLSSKDRLQLCIAHVNTFGFGNWELIEPIRLDQFKIKIINPIELKSISKVPDKNKTRLFYFSEGISWALSHFEEGSTIPNCTHDNFLAIYYDKRHQIKIKTEITNKTSQFTIIIQIEKE
jgi:hypothetical protein